MQMLLEVKPRNRTPKILLKKFWKSTAGEKQRKLWASHWKKAVQT